MSKPAPRARPHPKSEPVLQFRNSCRLSARSIDVDKRTVPGIAATESPVEMPDFDMLELIPEILLMSGCQIPPGESVPLLKDHDKGNSDAIVGSATHLRVDGNRLRCLLQFSAATSAKDIWTKVRERHLRDLSVGYLIHDKTFVPEGAKVEIAGREFTGPCNVVTSWSVREVSVTPIGADALAKMRGFARNPFVRKSRSPERKPTMPLSKRQRAYLIKRGMPKHYVGSQAFRWMFEQIRCGSRGKRKRDESLDDEDREDGYDDEDREDGYDDEDREDPLDDEDREDPLDDEDREDGYDDEDREDPLDDEDREDGYDDEDREDPMDDEDREDPLDDEDREDDEELPARKRRKRSSSGRLRTRSGRALKTRGEPLSTRSIAKQAAAAAVAAIQKREARVVRRRNEIRSLCDLAGVPSLAKTLVRSNASMGEIKRQIKRRRAAESLSLSPVSSLRFDASHVDKGRSAMRYALLSRTAQSFGLEEKRRRDHTGKPVEGWQDFQHASLLDMARACLELDGIQTRRMSKRQIAYAALGFTEQAGIRGAAAFHVTGNFPNLTLDAINKSMMVGFTERQFTWQSVFRQGESATDFKNIHRVRMSEAQNLNIWPDNTAPKEIAFRDEKETYAVEAYSNIASFSWRNLINDDMSVLTRVPQLLGTAAGRTVNTVAWSVVTANPTLQDGVALFSGVSGDRKKTNLTTGTVTVPNLGAARAIMRKQVGMNTAHGNASPAILNLQPRFLVVPSDQELVAEQVVKSAFDPTASKFQVYNPFKTLEVIPEPLLDLSSTVKWYLFASTSDIDTIEVTFLQGQETPQTDDWLEHGEMARKYQILQAFAVKALDFRGCLQSDGVDAG